MKTRQLVIVGGGFAGLHALFRLADLDRLAITVIDPRATSLVKPSLPEVAFAGKSVEHVRFPLGPAVERAGARFVQSAARAIDAEAGRVELEDGSFVPYDFLLLAVGARKDFDAIPGYREHGFSVCDDREAPRLARRLGELRRGDVVIGSAKSRWGTRVEVPSLAAPCEGPVGEMMFMLDRELRRRRVRDCVRIRVFSPGEVFFEDVGPAVRGALGSPLRESGIEVTAGKTLRVIHADEVEFEDGERWPSDLTMVIPPYTGHPLVKNSPGLGDEEGFVPTDRTMRHLDHPEVFAAGDGASLAMPKLGHIAVHQADIASDALRREVTGEGEIRPFRPEIFCIMNRGGAKATLILSDVLFGGTTDRAVSNPVAHAMKWGFDGYYYHSRGHLPPEIAQDFLLRLLREGEPKAQADGP